MPGPMSAPNGDRRLVVDSKYREVLRGQDKLNTGKTAKKNN